MAADIVLAYMQIMVRPNAPERFNEEKATYVVRGSGEVVASWPRIRGW